MASLATVPLEKLPVISVDLETTGLRPAHDRIVQIGACDPWDETTVLDGLVHPGIAIPSISTSIHNIDDAMVEGAETLPLALPKLKAIIGAKVIIGFNIGFDLAVLAHEAERHGLEWDWSAALCLRQLGSIALGAEAMLVMGDLDAMAGHYGIAVEDRHTALGDALITGRIYRAMLPDLKKKGIVTLADALRGLSGLDDARMATARAGWIDIAASLGQPMLNRAIERIDPYPYRHRIGELMLKSPLIMPRQTTISQAARRMKDEKRDCVFVGDDAASVEGIVSERDFVHALSHTFEEVARTRDLPLGDIMSTPVITVSERDFMHVALGRISHLDIRHLGVTDDQGLFSGWISTRELIRQRATSAMVIGDQLGHAQSGQDMADALNALPMLANSLLTDGVSGHDIAAVISGQYRSALSKAAQLAEQDLLAEGEAPPRAYAVLVLGSAGRGESLLAADQDHAIIFADRDDGGDDAAASDYFQRLGAKISDYLDEAGIPYCLGKVMSSEAKWCRSLSGWRLAISSWVKKGRPEDLLSVDIFFDGEAVYGDMALARDLQRAMHSKATRRPDFLKQLASNLGSHGSGSTFFGGIKTEAGRFNIKKYLLLPLVETLRILAISRGISQRSSGGRASALHQSGTVPSEVPQLAEDIHFCLKLVLRQQISDIASGELPTTKVDIAGLNATEKQVLKSIRGRVSLLPTVVQDCLF